MIKKFIVGTLCSLGFSFLLLLIFLSIAIYKLMRPDFAEITPKTVLELKLEHKLQDQPSSREFPLRRTSSLSLRDLIDTLQVASRDPHVEGLVVHLEGATFSGIAQIQELRNAIRAFRKSGKFAIAYNDTFGELSSGMGVYYFASAFDEIWVQPLGALNITGLAAVQPFGRKLLDELGVFPDIETREEYKTAYDFAKEPTMTPANRQQTQEMLASFLRQMVTAIAQERELGESAVLDAVNHAPIFILEKARQEGLIDKIAYKDELYRHLDEKVGEGVNFVEIHKYPFEKTLASKKSDAKIAVVFASGMIVRGTQKSNPFFPSMTMDVEEITNALDQARDDPTIKAIVFRVDSPGGSPLASDRLWHVLKKMREETEKPVIVSMGDVAASGGYWITLPAHKIVANPGTLTGSIGVILGKIASEKFWEKIGIRWDVVQTSPNAAIWSMIHPYTPEEKKWITGMTDYIYEVFIQKVSEGRRLPLNHVRQIAKGHVWTGEQALEWGLVDALGDLNAAIELAKSEAKLSDGEKEAAQVIYLPKPASLLHHFSGLLRGNLAVSEAATQILSGLIPYLFDGIQSWIIAQRKHMWVMSSPKVEH